MVCTKVFVVILVIACLGASVPIKNHKLKEAKTTTIAPIVSVNTCKCPEYTEAVPAPHDQPVGMQINFHNLTCNSTEMKKRSIQCKSVKNSNKVRDEICSYYNDVYNKRAALFVRICQKSWLYIGVAADKNDLCCEAGKSVQCTDCPFLSVRSKLRLKKTNNFR